MKISETVESKYLKAADILGKRVPGVISHCTQEEMRDGKMKPVLFLEGKEKGIVLNMTNRFHLAEHFGDETDNWPGSRIILSTAKTRNPDGKIVDGLVVEALSNPPTRAKVVQSENPGNGLDDIQF